MRMNPVYKNELKMSARSMQLPVLAVIFNSILSVVALIALYGIRQNYINSGGNPYHSMMILYVVVLTIEVVLLCLFVPSAAGGSIAGERERQTLDILLSSRMTVREIVTGKLLSCCDKHSNFSGDIYVWRHAAGITLSVSSLCGIFYSVCRKYRCFLFLPFQKDNLCFYIGLWFADCFDNRNRFAGSSP